MRIFLIIFSFINAFLYFLVYAYYDNILALFGSVNVTSGLLSFIKLLILVIFAFLIGLVVSLLIGGTRTDRSYFDYRIALIVGILPLIFLILSQGSITSFITVRIFGSNRQISELIFYFLSRQIVWAMWLGFAIGVSVRVAFKKRIKHAVSYEIESINQPVDT